MTNSKHTKKALISSVISLILCLSMLIGTTYAWFTDSVTSGINQIHAGTLDVELTHTSSSVTEAETVKDATNLFVGVNGEEILWEPGVVAWENLTVANLGTLALKYQMGITFDGENTVVDAEGNDTGHKLSEVLKVAFVEGGVDASVGRDAMVAGITEWDDLATFNTEVRKLVAGAQDETFGLVICWPQSSADNNWNVQNGKTTSDGESLHINLGINLYATQVEEESDSFDNTYDAEAKLTDIWDGSVDENIPVVDGDLQITSAAQLAGFAELVNGTGKKDVVAVLMNDIDLAGASINAIGAPYGGTLTFYGNGHKISNANLIPGTHNGMHNFGLFYAYTDCTLVVEDLLVEDIHIDTTMDTERNYGAGIILGYCDNGSKVTLDNVDVKNCSINNTKVDIGDEAAVYIGYTTGDVTMIDCDSTGCSVAGETAEKTGAFIGHLNGGTATLKNCTTDLTIGTCNRIAAGATLIEN